MNISNFIQIKRNPDLRIRKVQEQYYIFDRHKCYAVNFTGAIVVHTLEKNYPMKDFLDKLSEKFDVNDFDTLQKDVITFIEFLAQVGLVTIE